MSPAAARGWIARARADTQALERELALQESVAGSAESDSAIVSATHGHLHAHPHAGARENDHDHQHPHAGARENYHDHQHPHAGTGVSGPVAPLGDLN